MLKQQSSKIAAGICLVSAFVLITFSTAQSEELTQKDWMITLVDALGWSYGLPDEPQDPDYINILAGNREFRFEAEDIYAKGIDNVSIMSFSNFGTFSGMGWLHGTREATDVHLRFNLPSSGEYLFKAHLRQAGHQFKVGGKDIAIDAGPMFTEATIGSFNLDAGGQEIIVSLPPGGSIDYISLSAPNLAFITPEQGWLPDAPLTWETVNTTLLQLLKLSDSFPPTPDPLIIEAEDHIQPGTAIVDISYLGRPSNGKWLRIGGYETDIQIPLESIKSGFYDLTLRAMGPQIKIVVGDHHEMSFAAKAYLDDHIIPALYFLGSENNLTLSMPPGSGLDQVKLTRRQVDPNLTQILLGLEQGQPPSANDLDTIATLLAAFGVER